VSAVSAAARLLVAALLLAPPAAADTLYKCVDAQGLTTIQQAPCARGTTQVWARDTAPEPPPTPEQVAAAQARAEAQAQERARTEAEAQAARDAAAREAQQAAAAPPPLAPPPAPAAPDPCDDAKALAARLRNMPWLGLDDAQMQRLYGWVSQQCMSGNAAAATQTP
jgi:hypothetical protein